ncbi:DNA-binding SARP family transcriptional activator/tetratricopeptide (TPR) repeat protein [Actinoplanes octamycinicus]|uniref:DNA-binding SARP family transcriptional activator/tetratricopeptide (TPR) repeat protein n=1 Tax=Actinoplanes octamycinicus TaxID=135948 RepID=A0A7W7GW49_9ACTN|nr:BTAD domain-containing putative transcriptional regulator [Actinoplanes octamycinicus]MBB4739406.1 DNA-binding SARP family transcriptional activator/tetratricopeptide (TPR) repeat protein [Actinoplanes octamycinicus]GIE63500.1 SARP family transcriptional regulator [Actinoplanes octamycinicus]
MTGAPDAREAAFATRLRAHRRAAGLTQRELAAIAGISLATLRDLEQARSRHPQPRSVRALQDALGLAGTDAAALRRAATPDPVAPAAAEDGAPATIGILGPLVVHPGGAAASLSSVRQRVLLGRLALSAGTAVNDADLIEALWGDAAPDSARALLQTYVSRLRRRFPAGPAIVTSAAGGYRLDAAAGQLDALRFRELIEQARDAAPAEPAVALRVAGQALALWRGDPLADLPGLTGHPLAVALADERIAGALWHADLAAGRGRHILSLPGLRALAHRHPLHEELHARLMLALAATGQQAAALAVFDGVRDRLADELGIDPGAVLTDYRQRVLRQQWTSVAAPPAVAARPALLPPDVRGFVGRGRELDRLDALLAPARRHPAAVPIAVLSGTAGAGKTTLAVHWAHRVAARFPDGQLYADLRGFDPVGAPVAPAEAIRGFVAALGVPAARWPGEPAAQIGLYRTSLAGKRMLVLLDNARDADQVRPLLPGAPGCVVLITSRHGLTGLVAAEAAHPLALDLLSAEEAGELLTQRLGAGRTAAEPRAVATIVARCARLPLALAVAAARAATRPGLPLAALADELCTADRLDALSTDDAGTDVRTVFRWSYQALSSPAARLFRLLGVQPTPEFSTAAAASLTGQPVTRIRPVLAELTRAHLVSEATHGRYAVHDLLHEYAGRLIEADESGAATARLVAHYLHSARAADRLLDPARAPLPVDAPDAGVTVEAPADHDQAMRWFEREHRNLLALAAGHGPYTGLLAEAVATYLYRRGAWHDQVTVQRSAVRAAARAGDVPAQARARLHLARTHLRLRHDDQAETHLREALELYREDGDASGQAQTHHYFGALREQQGRHREAVGHGEQAVALCRANGLLFGLGHALNAVGWHHSRLGDHHQALAHCREAIRVTRSLGDRAGQANAWDTLGYAHHQLGDHEPAGSGFRRAIGLYRELGDRYYESVARIHLAESHQAAGRPGAAREEYRTALVALDDLGHPDAGRVRAALLGLDR